MKLYKKHIGIRMVALFLAMILALSMIDIPIVVNAESSSDWSYEDNATGITIMGYNGSEENITIPDSLEGKNVTQIGENAFFQSMASEIIIPDTVTMINEQAFYDCMYLEKLKLGNHIETIGSMAFANCPSLKEIILGESITEIAEDAFSYTEGIKIKGYAGSYAENYAKAQRLDFEDITNYPDCKVSLKIANSNSMFTVPYGETLEITWEFKLENNIPKGYEMRINGQLPSNNGFEGIAPIQATVPTMARIVSTGKPENITFTPTVEQCKAGETIKLTSNVTTLSKEDLEFELAFIDKETNKQIGVYEYKDGTEYPIGSGYHASTQYGEFTISATRTTTIANWVTKNMNGYRIYKGTSNSVDKQEKILIVGEKGVTPKRVEMYVEVNHSTNTPLHTQPVKFVKNKESGDQTTVLEINVPVKSAYFSSYSKIGLNLDEATKKIEELGYTYDKTDSYMITCTNYEHIPAVTTIEVIENPDVHKHIYGEWTVTKNATCTENGNEERVCLECKNKEQKVLPALGHKEVIDVAKEATCTEVGKTEGKHCSVCNAVLKEQEDIPALGHDMSSVIYTPIEQGKYVFKHTISGKCTRCQKALQEEEYCTYEQVNKKEATCTEVGHTAGTRCKLCKWVLTGCESIAVKEHIPVITQPLIPATDKTEGKTEGTKCSVCNKVLTQTKVIPALGTVISVKPEQNENGTYLISNEAELVWFREQVNAGNPTLNARLTKDIQLTHQWISIGYYKNYNEKIHYNGIFDGNGHMISGLKIENTNDKFVGLFSYTDKNAVVKNLGVQGNISNIPEAIAIGSISGENEGKIYKCYSNVDITFSNVEATAGGITGFNHSAPACIQYCYNKGEIEYTGIQPTGQIELAYGGIVGKNYRGILRECYNIGIISGDYCGAIAGFASVADGCFYLENTAKKGVDSGTAKSYPHMVDVRSAQQMMEAEFANTLTHSALSDDSDTAFIPDCTKNNGGYPILEWQENGHVEVVDKGKEATCTELGITEGKHCSVCNKVLVDQKTISALGHKEKTNITKATTTKDGSKIISCKNCKKVFSKETIYKVTNIKLSKTSYIYNGSEKKPSIIVKDKKGKTLKNGTDYTVSYAKGRKSVGQYSIKITLNGNYKGSKTISFKILPKKSSIKKLTAGSKQFKINLKKQLVQTTGYQIQYSTSSKFKSSKIVTIKNNKTTEKVIKKLQAKKKYYVRVRTYKSVIVEQKNVKLYSEWSSVQSVITKK